MSCKPEGLELIKKSLSNTEANFEFEIPHVFIVLGASVSGFQKFNYKFKYIFQQILFYSREI